MSKIYLGWHNANNGPSGVSSIDRCMISANRLLTRVSDLDINEWILDSGAYTRVVDPALLGQRGKRKGHLPVKKYAKMGCRWSRCGQFMAMVGQDYTCDDLAIATTGLSVQDHQELTIHRYDRLRQEVTAIEVQQDLNYHVEWGGYESQQAFVMDWLDQNPGSNPLIWEMLQQQSFSCRPGAVMEWAEKQVDEALRQELAEHAIIPYIMPVLQGRTPADYVHHMENYGDRLVEGQWIGVGSLCRRSIKEVEAILLGVKMKRPDLCLHGFGVKRRMFSSDIVRSLLYSADSLAPSYRARKAELHQEPDAISNGKNNPLVAIRYGESLETAPNQLCLFNLNLERSSK